MHTDDASRSFLFLLGSARPEGNTLILARTAAAELPPSASQQWLTLSELPLPAFEDLRHDPDRDYSYPEGNERVLLEATLAATDLVIASPLYWYSVSASTKLYLDYWSGWMRVPGADFKARMAGKTLWAVSVTSEEDQRLADPLVGTLRNTADYLKMRWGGALLGYANRPGDVASDAAGMAAAKEFFRD